MGAQEHVRRETRFDGAHASRLASEACCTPEEKAAYQVEVAEWASGDVLLCDPYLLSGREQTVLTRSLAEDSSVAGFQAPSSYQSWERTDAIS